LRLSAATATHYPSSSIDVNIIFEKIERRKIKERNHEKHEAHEEEV